MSLALSVLPGDYSICQLQHGAPLPSFDAEGGFLSATWTPAELSVVCRTSTAPGGRCEHGWRVLAVAGPLPFDLVGIVASLASVLAAARISIFVVSTFDTDYLLVRSADLQHALSALTAAGYILSGS